MCIRDRLQVLQGVGIDREQRRCGAALGRHVRQGRAVGNGEAAQARAEELDELADDTVRPCPLYTSDAAGERSSVDLGGRRIIKKKNKAICR